MYSFSPSFFPGETLQKLVHFIDLLKASAHGLISQFYQKKMQNFILSGFLGESTTDFIRFYKLESWSSSGLAGQQLISSEDTLKFLKNLFELVLLLK